MKFRTRGHYTGIGQDREYHKGDLVEVTTYTIGKALSTDLDSFVEVLERFVNYHRASFTWGQQIGRRMHTCHRTLQRNLIVVLFGILDGLGEQEYTDPRNEKAVPLAKKAGELYKEHGAGRMI